MQACRFAFLDHAGPIAFAHRGGALEAPENTWASFSRARDLGYRYMETDVHATSDGVAVAIHDPDLARMSGRAQLVRAIPWSQLATVRLHGGEPVPRLEELLAAWPEVRWNIDAKHDSVVDPLVETLRRMGDLDRVCVTSFSDRRLARIRRALGPRLCMAMGPAAVAAFRCASLMTNGVGRAACGALGRFGAAQVPLVHRGVRLAERRFVDAAHRAGIQVHVWTVDDEASMTRLLDLGVDGIMTDRPSVLKALLERRGSWA